MLGSLPGVPDIAQFRLHQYRHLEVETKSRLKFYDYFTSICIQSIKHFNTLMPITHKFGFIQRTGQRFITFKCIDIILLEKYIQCPVRLFRYILFPNFGNLTFGFYSYCPAGMIDLSLDISFLPENSITIQCKVSKPGNKA